MSEPLPRKYARSAIGESNLRESYVQLKRQRNNAVTEVERLRGAPKVIRDLLKLVDDLMPGIAPLALQDYKLVNEAPHAARLWLAKAEAKG